MAIGPEVPKNQPVEATEAALDPKDAMAALAGQVEQQRDQKLDQAVNEVTTETEKTHSKLAALAQMMNLPKGITPPESLKA